MRGEERNYMRERVLVAAAGIASLFLALSTPVYSQEAFTIPRSNRVILGELILPDKTLPGGKFWARFAVRDGTWVTIEDRDKEGDYFFGFSGIINDNTK